MAVERFFVTGTDTEAGKTVASCALLQAARLAGYRPAGYKPVASGCEMTAQGWRNQDALALQRHSVVALDYQQVNPLAFAEATAPHIVSAEQQQPITFSALSAGLKHIEQQADWVLTEGAGGWYTPLSDGETFADWVVAEQLPVILVVGVRLGCINHAMLTAEAVTARGLPLVGWIANEVIAPGPRHHDYLQALQRWLPAPLLGILPHITDPYHQYDIGHWLTLPAVTP
ncbi:dethiobiotin synthase [Erwinia sp. OLTSP20]|uniref:dethiobiotin synthase n=1 Tax=unclassified Erwinia TaxID=2622719 RepID=UPI000C190523|nr:MULTISPECIES: dethiobiotin synthase [unclassified Erwinia]PIJ48723.1 dethiobiotin synthase [Erwinia sp. OAMSP11]PIJ69348.1 dethiobiotin synthase [Erwinia sp. OLSSP12]PIJ79182.1 dethiobiotin synthase [Erwinia sp. OLCASP19]PIJ80708.1 dethiobiotin synthase [Erwinia sp. OLMTSP26]PIJ82858.1 dethiobiotin synthase [Erwinia sp. OLMDSP33]